MFFRYRENWEGSSCIGFDIFKDFSGLEFYNDICLCIISIYYIFIYFVCFRRGKWLYECYYDLKVFVYFLLIY